MSQTLSPFPPPFPTYAGRHDLSALPSAGSPVTVTPTTSAGLILHPPVILSSIAHSFTVTAARVTRSPHIRSHFLLIQLIIPRPPPLLQSLLEVLSLFLVSSLLNSFVFPGTFVMHNFPGSLFTGTSSNPLPSMYPFP